MLYAGPGFSWRCSWIIEMFVRALKPLIGQLVATQGITTAPYYACRSEGWDSAALKANCGEITRSSQQFASNISIFSSMGEHRIDNMIRPFVIYDFYCISDLVGGRRRNHVLVVVEVNKGYSLSELRITRTLSAKPGRKPL